MTERYVNVESYAEESSAEENLEVLECCGLHPSLRKEIDEKSEYGYVYIFYIIEVPYCESDQAAQVLREYAEEQDQELDFSR